MGFMQSFCKESETRAKISFSHFESQVVIIAGTPMIKIEIMRFSQKWSSSGAMLIEGAKRAINRKRTVRGLNVFCLRPKMQRNAFSKDSKPSFQVSLCSGCASKSKFWITDSVSIPGSISDGYSVKNEEFTKESDPKACGSNVLRGGPRKSLKKRS
jgi:hypothetical protein